MDQDKKSNSNTEVLSDFNIKDFFKLCLNKWYWIVLCMCFSVGIALFYIYRKQPEYRRYEQILVNDQDSKGGVGEISNSFSSMGLFSKKTNVYNELLTITSPAVLYQVADSLQLDMNYSRRDGLRSKTLYGTNQPFRIDMLDIDNQGSASFRIKMEPDGAMEFYKFRRLTPDGKIKYDDVIKVPSDTHIVETPLGRIKISENPRYAGSSKKETRVFNIVKLPMQTTVELLGLKFTGDLADQDADVIELSIEDVSVERAIDILNYVLVVYNQNWIEDKNRMAIATSNFIDDRLKIIESELGDVDKSIADYRKGLGLPDIQASLKLDMEKSSQTEADLFRLNNELTMANYMKDFLSNRDNSTSILPLNLGGGAELGNQIMAYNELLINRNNIASSSSETNPLVIKYDGQLKDMRAAIMESVNNQIARLKVLIANLNRQLDKVNSSMANSPEKALPLLSEQRQQGVKNSLYLFLLQKREENELTMKFASDNIRIITPPVGPLRPVSPKKGLIIIVALIIGFGVPLLLIYYLDSTNTTVRSKKDLDVLVIPFAGEVPQVGKKSDLKKLVNKNPLKKKEPEGPPLAVVAEGKRDIVNEAFRVIRGNIDFMSGKSTGQVIMLTSFNPGSGKSFIAYNLAMSFCLKGKTALIIDCDLRHGSSSMYVGMPQKGLTSYLSGSTDDWKSMVVKTQANEKLSILPIGKVPPNPAELLESDRLENLIETARKDYDIIFLDCPPVNIVVDTHIVASLADRTLFVVRAGLLDRSALKELNEFYEEKKFKNMSVILNGTEAAHSRYYTYGNYQNLG